MKKKKKAQELANDIEIIRVSDKKSSKFAQILISLKDSFKSIKTDEELFNCIKLKRIYLKARDISLPNTERSKYLLDSLIIATSYEERLTRLKISSKKVLSKGLVLQEKQRNIIINSIPDFYSKRKADQDKLLSSSTEDIVIFLLEIKQYIERVDDALEYVRSASFTMKSVLNGFKEYLND